VSALKLSAISRLLVKLFGLCLQQIHQKVMSSDYSEFKAEIKTVDSQDSLNGGVLVLVTGSLSTKSTGKRNFVQSFFLAPQEKGYFVLNDVFRYLDDEVNQQTKSAPTVSNGVPEAAPVHQQAPEPGNLPSFVEFYTVRLYLHFDTLAATPAQFHFLFYSYPIRHYSKRILPSFTFFLRPMLSFSQQNFLS
jgi:hypothetical protein